MLTKYGSMLPGENPRARACIRHLARHVSASNKLCAAKGTESLANEEHIRIPRMGLPKLLQKDVSSTSQAASNSNSSYDTSFTFMSSTSTQSRPTNVNDKYSFLNTTSWLDEFADELGEVKPARNTQSQDAIKSGGSELFSRTEMEAITQFIKDGENSLQLSKEEIKQVLALVEVVGEIDGVNQTAKCAGLDRSGQR